MSDEIHSFYLRSIAVGVDAAISIERETRSQNGSRWHMERQKRITASTARPIFTYAKNKSPNWSQKVLKHLNPKSIKTNTMKHGHDFEATARQKYAEYANDVVDTMGFVISPVLPWLGCSPDGFVFAKKKVVEIKCPVSGKTKNLKDMLKDLKYLNENMHLKHNHLYYAQAQIQMVVLNALTCDFIIYCASEESFLLIEIPFDTEYVNEMLAVLEKVYFKHFLPAIFENQM